MSWQTGHEPQAKPLAEPTRVALEYYKTRDGVLKAWQDAAQALELAKTAESRLRLAAFELYFPTPQEGTNRVDIGSGWSLKAQYPYSYRLTNKEAATERALDAMAEISQQAGFIADRLVKWEPELSIKEYRLLNPDVPSAQTAEQKAILALISPVLTIKPGMPQFELEPPKAK